MFTAKYPREVEYSLGASHADWAEMYYHQEGRCPICHQPTPETKFVTDHDHNIGTVRGLLCHRCNTIVGRHENGRKIGSKHHLLIPQVEHYLKNHYGVMHGCIVEVKDGIEQPRRLNERKLTKEEILSMIGHVHQQRHARCPGCGEQMLPNQLDKDGFCENCSFETDSRTSGGTGKKRDNNLPPTS